jgi:hypothetical protein
MARPPSAAGACAPPDLLAPLQSRPEMHRQMPCSAEAALHAHAGILFSEHAIVLFVANHSHALSMYRLQAVDMRSAAFIFQANTRLPASILLCLCRERTTMFIVHAAASGPGPGSRQALAAQLLVHCGSASSTWWIHRHFAAVCCEVAQSCMKSPYQCHRKPAKSSSIEGKPAPPTLSLCYIYASSGLVCFSM